jgi:hypothetical protein
MATAPLGAQLSGSLPVTFSVLLSVTVPPLM